MKTLCHLILRGSGKNERSNETCFPFKLLDCDSNWEVPAEVPVVHTKNNTRDAESAQSLSLSIVCMRKVLLSLYCIHSVELSV